MTVLVAASLAVLVGAEPLAPPDSLVAPLQVDTLQEFELAVFPPPNVVLPVSYQIAWGDGDTVDWTLKLRSPVDISRYHRYRRHGNFSVRVRARDSIGRISAWSRPLKLTVGDSKMKWVFPTFDPIVASPAVDTRGNVYVGDESGWLYCVDAAGQLKWGFETGGPVFAGAVIAEGGRPRRGCNPLTWFARSTGEAVLYVASLDSNLYCLDSLGQLRWKLALGDEPYTTPGLTADGTVIVGTDRGLVVAVTPDGREAWRYHTGSDIASSPTIGRDGLIYVTCDSVFCFEPDGRRRWAYSPPEEEYFFGGAVPDRSGRVYVAGTNGVIYLLGADGSLIWQAPVTDEDEVRCEIAVGRGNTLYFGTDGYYLCRKAPGDSVVALYEAEDIITSTPALTADGTIYFLSDDGILYALRADGRLLWIYPVAEDEKDLYYSSSPAIGPDGTVYVGSWDGGLYAFHGSSPPARTLWPQYRHDTSNAGRLPD